MNMRCVRLGSTLLLSMTIAFGPVVQAADQGVIHLAAAIGLESSPAPAKQPTKPNGKTPVATTKPAATPEQPPAESTGMSTSTKVWIGVGVAAGLALLAGGGGSSSATTHVPTP